MNEAEDAFDQIECFPKDQRFQVLGRIPVSFKDTSMESEFRHSQHQKVQRWRLVAFRFTFFIMSFSFASDCYRVFQFANLPGTHVFLLGVYAFGAALLIPLSLFSLSALNENVVIVVSVHICAVLIFTSNRFRAAVYVGDDPFEVFPTLQPSELVSDSGPLTALSLLITMFYVIVPMRCKLAFVFLVTIPATHLCFTIPILRYNFEGGSYLRLLSLSLRILGVTLLGFIGRATTELNQRIEFYRASMFTKLLAHEKVLRFAAEHEVAQGPMSSKSFREGKKLLGTKCQPNRCRDRREESQNDSHAETYTDSVACSSLVFLQNSWTCESDANLTLTLKGLQLTAEKEHWYVPSQYLNINSLEVLGRGGFGAVVKASYLGMEVAIKIPLFASSDLDPCLKQLGNELRILRRVRHPNIVTFIGACVMPDEIELIVIEEFVNGKSLRHLSHIESSSYRFDVITGICQGVLYLHCQTPAVIHGDLKPENILLEHGTVRPKAKLIDFGLSKLRKKNSESLGGSWRYIAPEVVLDGAEPDPSADMFSFGRVVFFVTTTHVPHEEHQGNQLYERMLEGSLPSLIWPSHDSDAPLTVRFFNRHMRIVSDLCCSRDASERPAMGTVLAHFHFNGMQAALGDPQFCLEEPIENALEKVVPGDKLDFLSDDQHLCSKQLVEALAQIRANLVTKHSI